MNDFPLLLMPSRRKILGFAAAWSLAKYCRSAMAQQGKSKSGSALLIGNCSYEKSPLVASRQDVQLMGGALEKLGFETSRHIDLTLADMVEIVRQWLGNTNQHCIRLLYYSGHGASFRGSNYLVPIDAKLKTPEDLPRQAFKIDDITDRLSRRPEGISILVIDACRNVPTRGLQQFWDHWNRTGFVQSEAPRGSFIAFATSPGAVAVENPSQGSSLYTRCLVKQLERPEQSIETVFKNARAEVIRLSNGEQIPMDTSTIVGNYQFNTNPFLSLCNRL